MRNFPWVIWPNKNGKRTSPVLSRDCIQAQGLLTVAFDGEANNEVLAQAQRHIAHCPHCAHQWRQWENTRVLLRSVAVPAVPASLLTRILLACRLLPVQNPEQEVTSESSNHERLAQYLEAIEDESLIAPLNSVLSPVPLPSDLHHKILQATTEAAPMPNFSLLAWLRQWVPAAPAVRNAMRWGMGLAVPAMLCWFVLADDPAELVEQTPSEVLPENIQTQPQSVTAGVKSIIKPLVKKTVEAATELPHIAAAEPENVVSDDSQSLPPVRRRIANVESSFTVRSSNRVPATLKSASAPTVKNRASANPTKARLVPTIDFVEIHTPSVVLASSQQPISRLPLQAPQQISHPAIATTPRIARLSESDFDEAFIAVTTARDNRPAEFGQAFDEYRAALLTEHSAVDDDMEEL